MQPQKNGTSNDWLWITESKRRMRQPSQSVESSESYGGCLGGLRYLRRRRRTVTHYVLSALRPSGAGLVLSASPAFYLATQNLREMIDKLICQSPVIHKH